MNFWLNIILYQTTWLIAIIGAANGLWWAGPAALALFAAWQLGVSRHRRADVVLLVTIALIGFVVDSGLVRTGLLSYAAAEPSPLFAPVWIVALWMSFALTLNHSLAYLQSHLLAASLLGGIGAPLAYWVAAHTWGAVTFLAPTTVVITSLVAIWAILTPLLCRFARLLTDTSPKPFHLHGISR